MADVLERAGCRIEFRESQTCCGQPAYNSGHVDVLCGVRDHFLEVFAGAKHIVVPSGSCAAMIAHHYPEPDPRVWEFSQFLVNFLGVDDLGAGFDGTVTYHDSCHALRELRIKDTPRRLLQKVRGLKLVEMDPAEECCGFGGTFSVKFPDVSGAMARTKIDAILKTGADTVVSVDSSCLMQIQGALDRAGKKIRTMHLAEVLAHGI